MNDERESLTAELIQSLCSQAKRLHAQAPDKLVNEAERFCHHHMYVSGLLVDWSRQFIDDDVFALLDDYANKIQVHRFLRSIADGATVNPTEQRSASHICHREFDHRLTGIDNQEVLDARAKMLNLAKAIRVGTRFGYSGKRFTDVLHVGIGGSHLGAELICSALNSKRSLRIHFITSVQPEQLHRVLVQLDPQSTLCVVASKSYTTFETIENARHIRQWFIEYSPPNTDFSNHFVHITSNSHLVSTAETVLHIPDTVGGRYSVWSSMGFPIALVLGEEHYLSFLQGAQEMDTHVLSSTEPAKNLAIRLATIALWNIAALDATSHLILTYDARLSQLTSYLQQLEMESNGKSVTTDQQPVSNLTCPVIWGGIETEGQHAYHQWLHQGTHNYSADILAVIPSESSVKRDNHDWVLANALAQSSVMLNGVRSAPETQFKEILGRHGSTVILFKTFDARTLGSLLALYEHKVACLGYFWGINSFDQWGVETGKQLANDVFKLVQLQEIHGIDPTLNDLVDKIKSIQTSPLT